jgi:hypothetical protein
MGALMPVGSGPDKEIVTVLNNLFSGTNLQALRNHDKKEKLFDASRRLHRVAARIGAYPARDYFPVDDAKRKWFYFLHHLPTETTDAIKRILRDALKKDKTQIAAVVFSVEENPDAAYPHLFPSNGEALSRYVIGGNKYRVLLIVPGQMTDDAEDPPNDPDGPPPETPIQWPTLKLRKAKRKPGAR